MTPGGRTARRPGIKKWLLVLPAAVALLFGPHAASAFAWSAPSTQVAATAQDPVTDPASSPAVTDLKACLAQKKAGDLVLLIDTSASLVEGGDGVAPSDPDAVRVDAATLLLTRLSNTLAQGGVALNVAIAGFDADTTTIVDFTPLTNDNLPNLLTQVATFKDRDAGRETDYWSALNWVNKTLEAVQPGGEQSRCQLAIWFTDGEFSLSALGGVEQPPVPGFESTELTDPDAANAVQDGAAKELCRVGGPADQMRLDNITLIAVGLGSRAADYNQDNFSLKNYAENPGAVCGAQPGRGLFIPAESVAELVLAFDALVNPGGAEVVRPDPKKLCQQQACAEGSYPFNLDDSLDLVHVTAVLADQGRAMNTAGIAVQLSHAGGAPLVITGDGQARTDSATVSGVTVDYQWLPSGTLTLDMRHSATESWAGEWTLTFIDTTGTHPEAVSRIQLTLTSDLQIIPDVAQSPWRAGETSGAISIHPFRLDGTPIDPTSVTTDGWNINATLDPAGAAPGQSTGSLPVSVDLDAPVTLPLPEDMQPGTWQVHVTLSVSLAGRPLSDVARQVDVQILPPLSSPTLVDPLQTLDFGQIEGTGTVSRNISVAGPSDGPGCAWVTDSSLGITPPSVSAVTIGSSAAGPDDCVTVAAGQTGEIPVSLTPAEPGNGDLTGRIDVHLAPATDLTKASIANVGYQAHLIREANQPVKWIVLICVMLLGIGIPVLALILARRWVAKFPANVRLQQAILDVQVDAGALLDVNGRPINQSPVKWTSIQEPTAGGHLLTIVDLRLRAKAGWRFTEPGFVEIAQPGMVGVCGKPPHRSTRDWRPLLPLSVENTWTLIFPAAAAGARQEPITGRLLMIIAAAASADDRTGLLNEAARDAPDLVASLRTAVRASHGDTHGEPGEPVPAMAPSSNPFQSSADGTDSGFGLGGGGFRSADEFGAGGFGGAAGPPPGQHAGFGTGSEGGFGASGTNPEPDDDPWNTGFNRPQQ